MKQVFLNPPICLLLISLIFICACSKQIPENRNNQAQAIATSNLPKDKNAAPNAPRVDSVLQFSVMITAIFEDSKGNFWFGSYGDGLCRYDGKEYTYFTANQGLPSGTVREFAPGPDWSKTRKINGGDQVMAIQEDQNGNIWVNTYDKLSQFNGQVFIAVKAEKESSLSIQKSAQEWNTELDYLWFSAQHKLGLLRYDGKKLVSLNFPPPYDYSFGRDRVSEIYKDQVGNIWFGTMENGIFRYDGQSFTRINKEDEIGICRSIFQDKTGRTWITNNQFGLSYLEDDSLVNFIKGYSLDKKEEGIVEEFKTGFQSIAQDKNGDLWFGAFGNGLWRYDGEDLSHITKDGLLPIVTVKSMYQDQSGTLWFGIGEGSVYGFDGESFYRFDQQQSGG